MAIKRILALMLMLLALGFVTACGDKAEDEGELEEDLKVVPNAYFIGSEIITAVQPEKGLYLSNLAAGENGSFIYTYAGFEDVGASIQMYAEMLIGEEHGFQIVNGETFRKEAAPDYTTETGTVSLSKDAENEKITVVRLDWSQGECVTSISVQDAPVIEEPKKTVKKNYGLSHTGAVEHLQELHPSVLQLEGDSMEIYNIYVMNGFSYVDGEACLRIEIYSNENAAETNVFMGKFFMSGNGEHIYRLNDEGIAVEMKQNP